MHAGLIRLLNDSEYLKNQAVEHVCVAIYNLAFNSENRVILSGACEGKHEYSLHIRL